MTPREKAIRREFLRWLDAHNAAQPNPTDFMKSADSVIDGVAATNAETVRIVRNLDSHGLITGVRSWGVDYPLRVHLTSDGQICVDDFDANVDRRLLMQRGGVDQSVSIGSATNVAAHSRDVTQVVSRVDVPALARAAREVLDALPELAADEGQRIALAHTARELLAEAESAAPDEGKVRSFGQKMRAALVQLGTSTASSTIAGVLAETVLRAIGG